jgi:hypothetical protein
MKCSLVLSAVVAFAAVFVTVNGAEALNVDGHQAVSTEGFFQYLIQFEYYSFNIFLSSSNHRMVLIGGD